MSNKIINDLRVSDVLFLLDRVSINFNNELIDCDFGVGSVNMIAINDPRQNLISVSVETPRGFGKTSLLLCLFTRYNSDEYNKLYVVPNQHSIKYHDGGIVRNDVYTVSRLKEYIVKQKGIKIKDRFVLFFDEISDSDQNDCLSLIMETFLDARINSFSARTPNST